MGVKTDKHLKFPKVTPHPCSPRRCYTIPQCNKTARSTGKGVKVVHGRQCSQVKVFLFLNTQTQDSWTTTDPAKSHRERNLTNPKLFGEKWVPNQLGNPLFSARSKPLKCEESTREKYKLTTDTQRKLLDLSYIKVCD